MTFSHIQGEELLGRVVGRVRFPEDPQRRSDGTLRARWKIVFTITHFLTCLQKTTFGLNPYILKAKKFAEPPIH